ncbi:MAG: carboxyl transferase domain-containing protein [Pseudomonadota bacterium]
MGIRSLLVSNRGEIAVRIIRAAQELGIRTVAVYSTDDADSLHARLADDHVPLEGRGVAAYLDASRIVRLARASGCDAIHPGYGFLAENAAFARACEDAGVTFVGPSAATVALFGDKLRARALAEQCGVPVLAGTTGPTTLAQAREFLSGLGGGRGAMIKAVAGGGGRGMRIVMSDTDLDAAYQQAAAEAKLGFDDDALYLEEFLPSARHIEMQVVGDGAEVVHLHERECSVQRRHQKLIEIAPSPTLSDSMRARLQDAALSMAAAGDYTSLGTFEFLVDAERPDERFVFLEANARLQVEHTVTEEVLGIDLVQTQLELAGGASLASLGLRQSDIDAPRGHAIQLRVNAEAMAADGSTRPTGGTLSVFEAPTGRGLRCDTYAFAGYRTNPSFDSLLAKLIVHSPRRDFGAAARKASNALDELRIEGVATNQPFLQRLLAREEFTAATITTRFVDDHLAALLAAEEDERTATIAGAQVNDDPLAVLDYGRGGAAAATATISQLALVDETLPAGTVAVRAPMQGTVVRIDIEPGDRVFVGQAVAIMEAMKMEHVITSDVSGDVERFGAAVGDAVFESHPLIYLREGDVAARAAEDTTELDLDLIRDDLREALDRHAAGLDENRPAAVAKRHGRGYRTARENVADLVDAGTFVEYGSIVIAAQRRRRSVADLIENTTGDGMVCGLGQINGEHFDESRARCMVMSYDYMVLAGTQGQKNHAKKDRMFEVAAQQRLPTVLFAEGGGGRPGDTDGSGVAGLDCWAFTYFARLSGLVPVVGITNGRCFAGNAVLLACCDVIIATEDANIGIGGPAMIEGGGLGVFKPEEVGPMDVQVPNGVVDIVVSDEAEAVAMTKKYLSYFQGRLDSWQAHDERELRFVVPENRLRYYDMREVIDKLADVDSVLEIRRHWGDGIITAFMRVEGRPLGVIANNPGHLAGAIDAEGADKGTRFMQLCDAFDIPLLFLCDCPGIMVGPESEKTALVRHAGRMFVTGANIDVPFFTIVTRKAYGLGAQAMAGGSFKAPIFCVSWPTGEFGGMGLEGAVKLGFRKELEAIEDPQERLATYEQMVADSYERGKAVNTASHFEIDEVIDPADSRRWIAAALRAAPAPAPRTGKKRPNVDTW